tara:strand:- start:740 stop:1120 length:381 start_codon:yes stop_codon:yes gene_type:complete
MEKIIAGRHMSIQVRTKNYINEQLARIETDYDKLTSARVVIDKGKAEFEVEIILHGKRIKSTAKASDRSLHTALNAAVEKADRQLRKHFDKAQNHNHASTSEIEIARCEAVVTDEEIEEEALGLFE